MWRYLLLLPLYTLSTTLPLLGPAGGNLEYEYALLSSYAALLLFPTAALCLPRRFLPAEAAASVLVYSPHIRLDSLWIFLLGPLFAFLPGLFLFWSKQCQCSYTGFGFWMLTLWLPAWVIAHAVYQLLLRARVRGINRKNLSATLCLVLLTVLLFTGAMLWFNPQKRFVGLIAGFLHGPIYDDFINFDAGIMLALTSHLLLGLLLLLLSWVQGQTSLQVAIIIIGGGFFICSGLASKYPSMSVGQAALDELLPQTLANADFTLHYLATDLREPKEQPTPNPAGSQANNHADQSSDSGVPLKILRLYRDAMFNVTELKQLLAEKSLPHVHVYVYPDSATKKLWFGGGSTDVADVYTPSIHLTAEAWPHPTLRHELVHALSSGFSFHGLGFHPNMAFTEGLAMALAPPLQTLSLHEGAAALLESGKLTNVQNLFSPAFWRVAGDRAYTVAGSLILYLLQTKGIDSVKSLYSGASWEAATGDREDNILQAWRLFIKPLYSREHQALFAEALYRYPGIFDDICPHSKADLRLGRDDGVFVRLRQPISWDPDSDYLPWLQKLDPNDQDARLRFWRQEIRAIVTDRFASAARLATWLEALRQGRSEPPATLEDIETAVLESDLLRVSGDAKRSLAVLEKLKAFSEQRYIGEKLKRDIEARLKLEQSLPNDQALEWRKFLAGWRKVVPEPVAGHWLTLYLFMRQSKPEQFDQLRLLGLLQLSPDPSLSASFHSEWFKRLGLHLMSQASYPAAAEAFKKAADLALAGQKDNLLEQARRAGFYSTL